MRNTNSIGNWQTLYLKQICSKISRYIDFEYLVEKCSHFEIEHKYGTVYLLFIGQNVCISN